MNGTRTLVYETVLKGTARLLADQGYEVDLAFDSFATQGAVICRPEYFPHELHAA